MRVWKALDVDLILIEFDGHGYHFSAILNDFIGFSFD
jgi:hypothetical protein